MLVSQPGFDFGAFASLDFPDIAGLIIDQAHRQTETRGIHVEDGWVYFLHGWSQVIAEVFHLELTPEIFAALDKAASSIRS